MFAEFHFIRPWWFIALLPLAGLLWYLLRHGLSSKAWEKVCDVKLLPFILTGKSSRRSNVFLWLIGCAGLLAIIALAGPVWERLPQPVFRGDASLVIALDLSQSMNAVDIEPSRLARARFKIDDFLAQRKGGQNALIAYSNQAFLVVPMTNDIAAIKLFLQSVNTNLMPTQGSRPDLALQKARELINRIGAEHGRILLVTDFVDEQAIDEAQELYGDGFEVSVLAIGTEHGGPIVLSSGNLLRSNGQTVVPGLDEEPLQRLAQAGGGIYQKFKQSTNDDIQALVQWSESGMAIHAEKDETARLSDAWNERGPWLLLLLLPLVAIGFRRGLLLIAFCSLLPLPADAIEWQDLWLRKDQRAMRALEEDDAKSAAEMFENKEWKAVAKYKNGKFEEAAKLLEEQSGAQSLYNKGNALMHSYQFNKALKSYNQALEINPQMEDAVYNRGIAKQALELLKKQAMQGEKSDQEPPEDAEKMEGESQQGQDGEQSQNKDADDKTDDKKDSNGKPQENGQQDPSDEQNSDAQQEGEDESDKNDESAQGDENEDQPENEDESDKTANQDGDGEASEEDAENSDNGDGGANSDAELEMMNEEDQALEQVMRRVQERPGVLLKRKFRRLQSGKKNKAPKEKQQW